MPPAPRRTGPLRHTGPPARRRPGDEPEPHDQTHGPPACTCGDTSSWGNSAPRASIVRLSPNGTTTIRSLLSTLVNWTINQALTYRRTTVTLIHVALIVCANFLAFALRFDGAIPPREAEGWRHTVLILIVVRSLTFIPMRLNEGLWRYTGIWDLQRIIAGVLLSSAMMLGLVEGVLRHAGLPALHLPDRQRAARDDDGRTPPDETRLQGSQAREQPAARPGARRRRRRRDDRP